MSQSPVNLDALRQRAEQAIRRTLDECPQTGVPDLTTLIEELRIYQAELEIQNQELVGAQVALADSLEKYRLLFESLPLPALLIDERGFIIEANPLAIHYLGLSRLQSPRRMLIYRLFDTVTRARLHSLLKEHAVSGPQALVEVTIKLNDGARLVADVHVTHLPEGSVPRGQSLLMLADQSARQSLRQSEINRERHALANLATANAVWDWDLLTGEIWWSQAFEPIFGYADGELPPVYATWQRCIHSDDRERVEHGLQAALASRQTRWSDRYRFRRGDGTYATVEDHAIISRDAEGRAMRMSGALRDVTQQTRVEEARQAQAALREQLDQLAASVPGVIYSYRLRPDGRFDFPYLSPRLLDVFGITAESALADGESLMALVHPDDSSTFSASAAASAEALSPWRSEFRIRHPHKGLVWIEAMAMPVRQAHGDIVWHGFMFDITARKALEDASRQHTHLLEVAQEAAGLGYYVTELQTGVWTSSPRMDDIMGIDPAFERTIETWGGLVHPDDRPQALAEFEQAAQRGEPLRHQYRIIRPRDGAVRWIEAWGRFECEQDRAVRMIGTVKDITERRQAEEQLRLSQFAIEQASDAVYWIHPDSSIFYVNEAACRMLGYSQAELTAMRVTELDPGFPQERWREHWNDIKLREHSTRLETTHRAKDGRIIPVEVSANFLNYLGHEYNCAIVRDISQRKHYESQLQQAADRYLAMLNTTGDGFWLVDATTARLLDVNPAACRMSGYSRDELLSMTIADLDIQHSEEDVARHSEAIARQGFELFETRHRTRDGRLIDVEVSTTHDPGTQTFVAFLRDITERKRTERELLALNTQLEARVAERTAELTAQQAALKQASARYRALIDHSTNFLGLLDPEGRVIETNQTALRFAGIAAEEIFGQPFWDTPWWRHAVTEQERLKAAIRQAAQGEHIAFETTHQTPDGTRISVDFYLTPIFDEMGQVIYLLPEGRDITERKEAAKRLQRSQEDLQLAIDAGQLGIWQWEIATDTLTWSEQMYALFHVSAGTPMHYAGFLGALHPDDREPTDLEIRAALAGRRDYVKEYRVLGPDGATPWRLALGRVYRNAAGEPEYMRGVVSDITERKQSEEAIRELNATLER
ncbi:MAG: PAS domain S-box protein, partial [Methylococcus sp.]